MTPIPVSSSAGDHPHSGLVVSEVFQDLLLVVPVDSDDISFLTASILLYYSGNATASV